jgi:hypothetical protein
MEARCRPSPADVKLISTVISPAGARVAGRGIEGVIEKQELVVFRRMFRMTSGVEASFRTVKTLVFEVPLSIIPVNQSNGVMEKGDSA